MGNREVAARKGTAGALLQFFLEFACIHSLYEIERPGPELYIGIVFAMTCLFMKLTAICLQRADTA